MKDLKRVFTRLVLPYWRDYIPYFIYAVIGMVISAGGASAIAYLVKPVLDEIFGNEKDLTTLNTAWKELKTNGLSSNEIAGKIGIIGGAALSEV